MAADSRTASAPILGALQRTNTMRLVGLGEVEQGKWASRRLG